jgi:hypothetical protein
MNDIENRLKKSEDARLQLNDKYKESTEDFDHKSKELQKTIDKTTSEKYNLFNKCQEQENMINEKNIEIDKLKRELSNQSIIAEQNEQKYLSKSDIESIKDSHKKLASFHYRAKSAIASDLNRICNDYTHLGKD